MQAENEWSNIFPKSSQARKKPLPSSCRRVGFYVSWFDSSTSQKVVNGINIFECLGTVSGDVLQVAAGAVQLSSSAPTFEEAIGIVQVQIRTANSQR